MPQHGYSIGRDISLAVTLPNGSSLNLGKVTNFNAKQSSTEQTIKGLDGVTDHNRYYEGWTGSFKTERRGPEIDRYFAQLEANYYAGIDEPPATMQQTILEPSGAVSQFRYERVLLKFDDPGDWTADKTVSMTVSFLAARRRVQA